VNTGSGIDMTEPACDRVPTKPLPVQLSGRIEIDLSDADACADFLDLVALILRTKRRLTLIVE
jgi:hypothetical protein